MKLPKHLIDAIGADPANCVLIVGAGLSKLARATDSGPSVVEGRRKNGRKGGG